MQVKKAKGTIMQKISLQDTILYPSPAHQAVEYFASYGNRCFTVLSQKDSEITLKQGENRGFWSVVALRIAQVILFPLTLIALALKFLWRSSNITNTQRNATPPPPPVVNNPSSLVVQRTESSRSITIQGGFIYGIENPILSFHHDGLILRNMEGTNIIRITREAFREIIRENSLLLIEYPNVASQLRYHPIPVNVAPIRPIANPTVILNESNVILIEQEGSPLRAVDNRSFYETIPSSISSQVTKLFRSFIPVIPFRRNFLDLSCCIDTSASNESGSQPIKSKRERAIDFLSTLLSAQLTKSEKERTERLLVQTSFPLFNYATNLAFNKTRALMERAYFTPLLFERSKSLFFPNTNLDFKESLAAFRYRYQFNTKENDTLLGYGIMTKLPMLMMAEALMSSKLSKEKNPFLSKTLENDIMAIHKKTDSRELEGSVARGVNKFLACVNLFDPHLNGNLPFHVGSLTIKGQKTEILRHAVPTNEAFAVTITEEYMAFLEQCKKNEEQVLYCCLLNPDKSDEKPRIEILTSLQSTSSPYKNTFHFAKFPLDGDLEEIALKGPEEEHFTTLIDYKKNIQAEIIKATSIAIELDRTGQFIFSNGIKKTVRENYAKALDWSFEQVALSNNLDDIEKKQVMMMLFCTTLKHTIFAENKINYYNNTCKDAIDRGAAHLISDLIVNGVLTDSLEANKHTIRVLASAPAFIAKTQAVLKDRASWYIAVAKWAEGTNHAATSESYKSTFNLDIEPIQFDNSEPMLNETEVS